MSSLSTLGEEAILVPPVSIGAFCCRDDLFKYCGEAKRPPYRWIVIGPPRLNNPLNLFGANLSSSPLQSDHIDWTGLAPVSTLTHWGLQHGTLSSLATSGGASSPLTLQRSESASQVLSSHITMLCHNMMTHLQLDHFGRTWSLWKVLKEGNRWGANF